MAPDERGASLILAWSSFLISDAWIAALAELASESWIFNLTQRTARSASSASVTPIEIAHSVSNAECGITLSKIKPE